jgi:hypothetical protein
LADDGLVDYLVLFDGDEMTGYRNTGNQNKGDGANLEEMGVIAGGVSGITGESVRFAISTVTAKSTSSQSPNPAPFPRGSTNVRLADLNGDGRADLLYINEKGGVDFFGPDSHGHSRRNG